MLSKVLSFFGNNQNGLTASRVNHVDRDYQRTFCRVPDETKLSPSLLEKRRTRDHVLKAFTQRVRISLINNTRAVTRAQERHQLSPIMTKLVGRAMSAASLLASWQYGDERVILEFRGTGPVEMIYAEAIRNGEVRAYTTTPKVNQASNMPLGLALGGGGTLRITKVLYNQASPYHSVVPLASADISSDIFNYYKYSEQIPAYVDLDTQLDYQDRVTFSGGLIIEALPALKDEKSNQNYLEPYVHRLQNLPPMSVLFGQDKHSLKTVLKAILQEELEEHSIQKLLVDFHCRCSKDKITKLLIKLQKEDLREFLDRQPGEKAVTCQFCNERYMLDTREVEELEALSKD
ncbi:33 kDa chaperonin-like [Schistocerca gregaria]|uniref:33 kDa chaperonin-like n=1 Tax=Schistocerca gregaria TaxID=7010 RepID=UPI00211F0D10|nr:33 kDa chaperonin-like [Schistocerca gregaria]